LGIFAVAFLFISFWYKRRLNLAIAIIKTATLFMNDNFSSILLPVCSFFILLAYTIYWMGVALLLYSIGDVSKEANQLPYG